MRNLVASSCTFINLFSTKGNLHKQILMACQIIQKNVVIETSGMLVFLRSTADINVREEVALDLWFPDAVISFVFG